MIWIPAGNVTRHTDSLIAPDMDFLLIRPLKLVRLFPLTVL